MITRFETIAINNLAFTTTAFGERTIVATLWFNTRARVHEVNTAIAISDKYRAYHDITQFTINYSPNSRLLVGSPGNYSITFEGQEWRIEDSKIDDTRQFVTLICYRNDPVTAV